MHPYDIAALLQTDKVYRNTYDDRLYRRRRENTLIIGSDVLSVSDRSFAASMGTHVVSEGYDIMLTDIGDSVVMEAGTKAGKELIARYAAGARNASEAESKKVEAHRAALPGKYKRNSIPAKESWRALLEKSYNHPVWDERSERCIQCSSCTMVCPTCYCYDVRDENALDAKSGTRMRTWDCCLLPDFTKVASGEIFRESRHDRYRHRFYRKGAYIPNRYGYVACVGCGRRGIACLPDIADPYDIINELKSRESEAKGTLLFGTPEERESAQEFTHMPGSATIKRIEALTEFEKLFEIEMDNGKTLCYAPGQFVEVSIFGYGEAPISISSPPLPPGKNPSSLS